MENNEIIFKAISTLINNAYNVCKDKEKLTQKDIDEVMVYVVTINSLLDVVYKSDDKSTKKSFMSRRDY